LHMTTKATRLGAFTLSLVAAHAAPLLAMDQSLTLDPALFQGITTKTMPAKKTELLAGVRKALDGKLRKGLALDASMEQVGKVMDAVSGMFGEPEGADAAVSPEQEKQMAAAAGGKSDLAMLTGGGADYTKDAEPLAAMLREKGLDEDTIKKACDMFPKNGLKAGDESPEEKEKREKAEAEKKAADEAKEEDDKEKGKQAMDAAIKTAVEVAIKSERKNASEVREALHYVTPWVGTLAPTLAMDSAVDVYQAAGKLLKIDDVEKVSDPFALRALIKSKPLPGAKATVVPKPAMAMDEKTKTTRDNLGLDRIKVVA
jgi:hypothetical protein